MIDMTPTEKAAFILKETMALEYLVTRVTGNDKAIFPNIDQAIQHIKDNSNDGQVYKIDHVVRRKI
jgi:hypothetical protein